MAHSFTSQGPKESGAAAKRPKADVWRTGPRPPALLLLFSLAFSLSCFHQVVYGQEGISLSAAVDRTTVPLDGQLVFTVAVQWTGAISDYDIRWPSCPDCVNLEVVGHASSNEVSTDGGRLAASTAFSYTLKPLAVGKATIGASALTYLCKLDTRATPRTLSTQPITVSVLPPASRGKGRVSSSAIAIVALWVAAGVLVFALYRRRHPPAAIEQGPGPATPQEEALARLEEVGKLRASGEPKRYYADIAQVLTRFLERKWSIQCAGVSTYDTIQRMRQHGQIPEDLIEHAEKVLSQCDLVKFAGHDPQPLEMDHIMDKATALIRQLGALSDQDKRAL